VEQCSHLDPDKAFVLELLHDIGRRYGKTNMRHSIDGYNFCKEQGYDLVGESIL
jgi:HD superfamily phosphodiesterase